MLGASVRNQQLHAHVLPREVIRGVVGGLPHKLESLRVGDELSAKVRPHSLWSVLDMNALSDFRNRSFHNAPQFLPSTAFRSPLKHVQGQRRCTYHSSRIDSHNVHCASFQVPSWSRSTV